MGLFDRFLSRAPKAPLLGLEALLEARAVPVGLAGLEALAPSFEAHRDAAEREAWVDAVAELHRAGLPLPPPWHEAQDHLLPELVPTWRAEREGRWHRLFIEGLCQRICLGDSALPTAWIRLWDQSPADVQDQALDNLRHRSEGAFERLPSGIYRGPWRDGHDAARLLLPETWDRLFKDQHPFLAIPTPGLLLAAPQILLPKLVDAVGRSLQEGAPLLQAAVLERIDDQLMTARIQEPHPMSGPQREFKQLDQLEAIRTQEEELDPALGRPAPVGLLKTQQGKSLSVATWMAGAPALLPEAELVAFVSEGGESLGIYWRQSLPRISELRGETVAIWGPRRVRFEGFPDAEQLARLECFATAEQVKAMQAQAAGRQQPSQAGRPQAPVSAPVSAPSPAPVPVPAPSPIAGPQAASGKSQFSTQPTAILPRHLHGAGLGVQDGE